MVFPLERFRWATIPSSKQNTDVNGKHTQAPGLGGGHPASGGGAPPCPLAAPLWAGGASGRARGPHWGTDPRSPAGTRDGQRRAGGRGGPAAVTQRRGAPGCDRYFLFPRRRRGCWCVRAWPGGAGRRHPWTGGEAAAGGDTPREGPRRPPGPAATAPPLSFPALPILPLSSPPGGEAGTCCGSPPLPASRRKSPDAAGAAARTQPQPRPRTRTRAPVAARSGTAGPGKAQSQRPGAPGTSAPAAGRPS